MAKMSNQKKEKLAVMAIERETLQEGAYLVADIPVGDKAPSFDGQITVYKDDSQRKESYLNDVPTQVKGKGVQKFTKGNIKFPLNIKHFENYYKRGGCLLLVVEILESTETKIFYKQLLPTELRQIIDTWGHQKSVSVELRPLEETTLYIVCRKFIDQMIKQPRILIEKNQYDDTDYEKLILTSMTFNPNKSGIKDIFNHDFVQFGLKDNIEYPIRNIRIDTIAISNADHVEINGKVFEVMVRTSYSSPSIIKLVEDSLEFVIDETNNKLNFTIKHIKSLATQLKVLPLLIEFLKAGEIRFTDFYGNISFNEGNQYTEDLEETYSLFLKLQQVFLNLNINENTLFGNEENVHQEIQQLVDIMLNKKYNTVNVKNPNSPHFIKFTIGNIYLILYYNPSAENKFINAFAEEVLDLPIVMVPNDTQESASISPYLLLSKETLINAANLDIDAMIKSFSNIDFEKSELLFSPINNFCLVCLNAYDLTGNKKLLQLPLYLLTKLKEKITDNLNKHILTVNLFQTNLRLNGELSHTEYKELLLLKDKIIGNTDNLELRFCISVLLQSKKEAEILFEEFPEDKKEFYNTLPINTLFNELN